MKFIPNDQRRLSGEDISQIDNPHAAEEPKPAQIRSEATHLANPYCAKTNGAAPLTTVGSFCARYAGISASFAAAVQAPAAQGDFAVHFLRPGFS